ncbi:MAG: aldolase, partial [Chloroflexi bacterium]|nr:aldolase [Chloroflexota bacterium]
MGIGKQIRLQRLFAHPSGHFCSVAVDHLISYGPGMPDGLRRVRQTLEQVVAARPDAVTMHKGIATSCWAPYAGVVPLILQTALA